MGEITDRFDATMNNVVPLAMKKWALDIENQKWQDQLAETKRQHSLNAGLKFLESGDFTNAEIFLKDALPGLNAGSLSQSPMALLKAAEVKAKQRQFDIDEDVGNRLKDITVSGRTPTLQDLIDVRAAAGDSSAAFLKALTTQAGMESLMEKLKMQNEHNRAVEAIMSRNADSKNILALAAMMRAEKAESGGNKKLPPSYEKALDNLIAQNYLSDPAIGPSLSKKLESGKLVNPAIDAFQVMDPHQQEAALRIKEHAAEALQTGEAKTISAAYKVGLTKYKKEVGGAGTANPAGAGIIKWGRDANGNPVRIK